MNNLSSLPISRWSKIFTLLIVAFPILDIYAVGVKGISIGSVLLSIALIRVLFSFLKYRHYIKWNPYYGFCIYGVVISLIILLLHNEFSVLEVFVRLIYFLFYILLIFMPSLHDFNIVYAGKIYLRLGLLAGGFLILQYICFWGFGYTLIGLIPGLSLNYSITDYTEWINKYSGMYEIIFRPTSVFPEPAAFAQYMAPLLILTLFTSVGEKRRLILAGFISIVMILSTSTNGIVFSISTWMIYFIYYNYKSIKRKNILTLLFPLITFSIVFFFFVLLTNDNSISNYTARQFNDIFDMNTSASGYIRVLRGFDIYSQLNILEEIFGIGLGTYRSYYAMGSIYVLDGEVEYMSSLSYLFVSTGIIGFLLFIYALFYNSKGKGICSKLLAMWIILVFTSSSLFNSPVYALVYLLILYSDALKINQSVSGVTR